MKIKIFLISAISFFITFNIINASSNNFKHLEIGSKDAPVIMYEFFAVACSACAKFNSTVMTQIKTDFVDTGKLRIIYISYPIFPDIDYFAHSLLHTIKNQNTAITLNNTLAKEYSNWVKNPVADITNYALLLGVSQAEIDSAKNNQQLIAWFSEIRKTYKDINIEATPTTILVKNGDSVNKYKHKFVGVTDYKTISNAINTMIK